MTLESREARQARCLIVQDDAGLAQMISHALKSDVGQIEIVNNGKDAVERCHQSDVDIVILDSDASGAGGQQLCQAIRVISDAYILMVTDNKDQLDRVLALAPGADGYITKPFSETELRERASAMLSRPRRDPNSVDVAFGSSSVRRVGNLSIDTAVRLAASDAGLVDLTERKYEIVAALVMAAPGLVCRADLIAQVWGEDSYADGHIVDVHISNIRRKLKYAGVMGVRIQSVRSQGFRLLPVSPIPEP